jgi:predicted HTH transcriptional regulator
VRRRDVWSIPLGILREMIINALVHSDYSQRGAPIRVVFLDDRIEVESMGILMPGLTVEEMKQGTSRIRNPVIARVFKELGLIEQWGTGVRRIFAEAKELNLPEPKIEEIALRLRFTVYLAEMHLIKKDKSETPTTQQATEQVTEQVKRLLSVLKERELASKEAMLALHLNHRPTFLYDYLQPALSIGLVEMTQPDSPRSPTQKYRLTTRGKQVLEDVK